jgi:hypothetical protein
MPDERTRYYLGLLCGLLVSGCWGGLTDLLGVLSRLQRPPTRCLGSPTRRAQLEGQGTPPIIVSTPAFQVPCSLQAAQAINLDADFDLGTFQTRRPIAIFNTLSGGSTPFSHT